MYKNQELLNRIVDTCRAAGATPKVYVYPGCRTYTVALGQEWMDNATDTGTKYDNLIDALNVMGAEPCRDFYGSDVQRVY